MVSVSEMLDDPATEIRTRRCTVKPAFGGSDLDVLFVTSIGARRTPSHAQPFAGGLFALTGLGVQGVPEVRFRG